jgi:UPF0755 protein
MQNLFSKKGIEAVGLIFVSLAACFYVFFITPPKDFPENSIFTVEEGMGLEQLAQELESENIVRSSLWFRIFAILSGGERGMKAGDYLLEEEENVVTLAWRIAGADHRIETVKITIPEGFTNEEISELFDKRFLKFNHAEFLELAPQGFLFPDTYFIEVGATASSTIKLLKNNFINKISKLEKEIKTSGHSLSEIVNVASIIESEVRTTRDRGLVSGIIWRRLKIGMPLQVDSAMETYERRGLPAEPISNPGIESIVAAIHPISSNYLYFLTDKKGTAYYAKDFDGHQTNRELYLNK